MMALQDDVARVLPDLRLAFDGLKHSLRDGPPSAAAVRLCCDAVVWGEELQYIYAREGRSGLQQRDVLTRLFILRARGGEPRADLDRLSAEQVFLLALRMFSPLDAMIDGQEMGDLVGFDEDGNWMMRRIVDGERDGTMMRAARADGGWRFDLLPFYRSKARALKQFIGRDYGGDFDLFLERYHADRDQAFDLERAWRPVGV
jgi:hypothetical protein